MLCCLWLSAKWQHIQINRNLVLLSEMPKIRLNCGAEFHRVKSCYFEAAHNQWWWESNCWIILTIYLKNSVEDKTVGLLQSMSPGGWPKSVLLFCWPLFLFLLHAKSKRSLTDYSMKWRAGLSVFYYVLLLFHARKTFCTLLFKYSLFESEMRLEGMRGWHELQSLEIQVFMP